MYDGSDSQYYLDSGFRVVAVEANPVLVERAQKRFARQLESGQMTCVHAAVATTCDPIDLTLCGDDLGSSSTLSSWVTNMPIGAIRVPGITLERLLEQFGVPYYLK